MKHNPTMTTLSLIFLSIFLCLGDPGHSQTTAPPQLSAEDRAIARSLAEEEMETERRADRLVWVETRTLHDKATTGDDAETDRQARTLALVIHYDYATNAAILTTVDPRARRMVERERIENLPVPLAEEEYSRATRLALDNPEVREILGPWADQVTTEVLLLYAADREDPVYGKRVVRLMFKVDDTFLDRPIVRVDLSEGTARVIESEGPGPEALSGSGTGTGTGTSTGTGTGRGPSPSTGASSRPERGEARQLRSGLRGREIIAERRLPETLERFDPADLHPFSSCCPRHTSSNSNLVEQRFPPTGPTQTAWRVSYGHATGQGLFITGAWFKKSPDAAWMRVLWDARLSDIFVPYHSGSPRYLDLTGFNFSLVPVTQADLGCCGRKADDHVVREVRDRGVLWKQDDEVRRGHELVLWGTLGAANYNYIIAYHFRDDGSIGFRMGATSQNLPGARMEAHMHNGLWRVDVDLDGAGFDSALLTRHTESGWTATDQATPFNGGREGAAEWEAEHFTGIRIQDTRTRNDLGEPIAYDVMSRRPGNARHAEPFMKDEFWVTRYRYSDRFFTQLPTYVANQQSVTNTDIVLWTVTPAHHLPRREDGNFLNGPWNGVALVMWTGFDLRPRNLFDGTPLYP